MTYQPDEYNAVHKVRMTGRLMEELVAMASEVKSAKVVLDWGEPDAEGFYEPTITVLNNQPITEET